MRFEKVSFEQYCKDCGYDEDILDDVKREYDDIKLPKRATEGSMGYDFFMPFYVSLEPNESIKIPTGIRWISQVKVFEDYEYARLGLKIYPRSGLGFKYMLGLANTVGLIDEDYMFAENDGHIMIKLVNNGDKRIELDKGVGFAQGEIGQYFVCDEMEENFNKTRTGGFGSTDK